MAAQNAGLISKFIGFSMVFWSAVFVLIGLCSPYIGWRYVKFDEDANSYGYMGLVSAVVCMKDSYGLEAAGVPHDYATCKVVGLHERFEDAGRVAFGLCIVGLVLGFLTSLIAALRSCCAEGLPPMCFKVTIFQSICSLAFYLAALGNYYKQTQDEKYPDNTLYHGYILTWIGCGLQFFAIFPLLVAAKHQGSESSPAADRSDVQYTPAPSQPNDIELQLPFTETEKSPSPVTTLEESDTTPVVDEP